MYNIIDKRNKFDFGKGDVNEYSDFLLKSSHKDVQKYYDVLVFTDSKGSVANFVDHSTEYVTDLEDNSLWTDELIKQLEKQNLSFILVSRPKILTIFFTLINFLKNNDITFNYLITNIGFVDLTPKKMENMEDIVLQTPSEKYQKGLSYRKLSPYKLSSGEKQHLYTFNYGDIETDIVKELESRFSYSLLIGCLEFSENIKIPRERPIDFFRQLNNTNRFLFDIANKSYKVHYLQPLKYPYGNLPALSLDAVHQSDIGHVVMFKLLKPYIETYFV